MLVLTRKKDEAIVIGDNIKITVVEIQGDKVKLGIEAPRELSVYREEIYESIREENRRAVLNDKSIADLLRNVKGEGEQKW
ncbi:MAG: carbon storage regulator CsrA [Syntrophomonadaceae bacterium]|nr:carbon storage regulator CsrA [Syntrophomonadaceae bacterium]